MAKRPVEPTTRWVIQTRGAMAHTIWTAPRSDSVIIGDGWGVAFASLGIKRHSLRDGTELAKARTRHSAARCYSLAGDGSLLVVTQSKLLRLDPLSLDERESWLKGVPQLSDHMVESGGLAVLANGALPSVASFDLSTGKVRRRKIGEYLHLFPYSKEEFLIVVGDGRVLLADFALTQKPRELTRVDRVSRAALGGSYLWISHRMVPEPVDNLDLRPDSPGTGLTRVDLRTLAVTRFDTGFPAWLVAASPSGERAWLLEREEQRQLIGFDAWSGSIGRSLAAPGESRFKTVEPEAGVAFAAAPGQPCDPQVTDIYCLELGQR